MEKYELTDYQWSLDRDKMEERFGELLTKLSGIQTVINLFSASVEYVPLGQTEQHYAFSSLETLVKDILSEADLAYDEFRKIKD